MITKDSRLRVGFGLGTSTSLHGERFGYVVDELERMGFDIPWVSDRIRSPGPRDEPHTTDQWTDHLAAVAAEILPSKPDRQTPRGALPGAADVRWSLDGDVGYFIHGGRAFGLR